MIPGDYHRITDDGVDRETVVVDGAQLVAESSIRDLIVWLSDVAAYRRAVDACLHSLPSEAP